jgi:long-subunit fatty acid transport protein
VAILFAASTAAMAACPPALANGTTAETLHANSLRMLCLQQELAADTAWRKYQFDLKAMQRSFDQMQLKQRLGTVVPAIPPPLFP